MAPPRQSSHRRMPSTASARQRQSRLEDIREGLHSLFSGDSTVERERERERGRSSSPESPKAPRLVGLGALPSTRIIIPGLNSTRTSTHQSSRHPSVSSTARIIQREELPLPPPFVSRPNSGMSQATQLPAISTVPRQVHRRSERRYIGADPGEQHLVDLVQNGRRRRGRSGTGNVRATRYPKTRNKKIQAKMASSLVSGIFLILVLSIYLALALSNKHETQEFHVLLILIILIVTIFFCHSLIRLCMMLINPPPEGDPNNQRLPSMVGPGGYAEPSVPIPVSLARDEEAAGIESDATKVPPPAYGLWRETVRVDPNRIYWQRNEAASQRPLSRLSERSSANNRPPSYLSDDGVEYAVEAAPRSTVEEVIGPHPAERLEWPRP